MSSADWSTPEELVGQLMRMWDRGEILTEDEHLLLHELLRGTHGEQVRLEQERIEYRFVRDALDCLGR